MKQFEDGDPCFAPMLNALFAAFRGTAVMDGCEASATGTSRAVSITAGSVQIDGVEVAVGAGSVTLDAGGAFDRYDLISVDASGSKIVTKGATKRKCPTQPANTCLLAIVFVPAGATVIATGDVYDARMDALTVTRKRSYAASDNVLYCIPTEVCRTGSTGGGSTLAHQIRVPPGYLTSKFRIKFDFKYYNRTGGPGYLYAQLRMDGVTIKSVTHEDVDAANTWKTFSIDVENVSGRTLFQLYIFDTDVGGSNKGTVCVRNTCICGTEETFTQIIGSDTLWE